MASIYTPAPPLSIFTLNNAASRTSLSAFSFCPFLIRNQKSKAPKVAQPSQYSVSRSSVSCKATKEGDNNLGMFERRNILIGLGGLYGTATTLNNDPFSLAAPISPPDINKCVPATVKIDDKNNKRVECCPPLPSKVPIPYKLPLNPPVKKRPAAQFVDATYIRNYEEAVRRMKALPDDDPRNFYQQAKVHCAYCNSGYQQVGFPDLELQVHDSWIFFPFHRWYLYFYERILGSLIKDLDPNFAIPFWNWDSDLNGGMQMPSYYDDPKSPLYDSLRNPKHRPPALVDLDYNINTKVPTITLPDEEQVAANLSIMYTVMVRGAKDPCLFFGGVYRAGCTTEKAGRGTVENGPHGAIHRWTGGTEGLREDLGNFYSAGRDPIFYSHHANVDRMWPIWKSLGGKRKDITDPDWLESGFLFYDENKNLVSVKVKDCLDTRKLGYEYQQVPLPWLESKPKATLGKGRFLGAAKKKFGAGAPPSAETFQEPKFPLVLESSIVSTIVKRPKKNRSKAEKEEEEEVLVIEGIEFDRDLAPKFDIYINDEDDVPGGPTKAERAGSFVHVPHGHKNEKNNMKTRLRLGITDLLEDLGADDDDLLVVTLVPKIEKGRITIDGIKIELSCDIVNDACK